MNFKKLQHGNLINRKIADNGLHPAFGDVRPQQKHFEATGLTSCLGASQDSSGATWIR